MVTRSPWLILTDLTPTQANICWYGMRSWIECLFQDAKRGGSRADQNDFTPRVLKDIGYVLLWPLSGWSVWAVKLTLNYPAAVYQTYQLSILNKNLSIHPL